MSKWGSARGTPTSPFADADDTESVSSKAPARAALVTPTHFQNFRVTGSRLAHDATGKQVGWYDVEVSTIDCIWTVVKRFSDCSALFTSISKLKFAAFEKSAKMPFPSFPSKFHVGRQSQQFLDRRGLQLESFFQHLLLYLQRLSIAAVGAPTAPPYMKILTAGFTMLVDFARRNSSTGDSGESGSLSARTAAAPVEDPLIMQSRRDLLGAANLLSTRESSDREPRVRLIHLPKRFTIAIFLPGVLLKNVFVDTTDIGDRIVTVGGCWTDGILSADDVRDDIGCPKGQDSYRGKNSGASVGEARTTTVVATSSLTSSHDSGNSRLLLGSGGSFGGRPSVLQDSLPRGSFEMHYEVPLPYERCHWSSEYEAGVLFLHWDHP